MLSNNGEMGSRMTRIERI